MIVLGLHRDPWHDTGAAIIRDDGAGPSVVSITQERLDRVKDSRAFPDAAIKACMAEARVASLDEIDLVVIDYIRVPDWRADEYKREATKDTLLEKIDPSKIHVINHHLAHAASAYYSSTYDDAAIVVIDGRGSDNETQSIFCGEGRHIRRVEHTDEIGIGLLYSAVTHLIGFGLLQEGKTMGLAPYGKLREQRLLQIPKIYNGAATDYSGICKADSYDLFDPPALPDAEARADAAREVQAECEEAILYLCERARRLTGKKRLCLSGGVALNSVANYAVVKSGLYEDVFINPACSDTGIPLGAALHGYHVILGAPRLSDPISPYCGPRYGRESIEAAVEEAKVKCEIVREEAIERTIDLLAENRIVGHFHGRSEMGPRALGNRSILMNPGKAENKDILNARVKHREAFRPFAPVCLEEAASEYFDIDRPSPYMLLVPLVRPEKRDVVPAITHVDGTGRLQTVARSDNPRLYELIERFAGKTGVPILLNTSFNDNGEPIVESPLDAVRCFLGTDIDALLLEDVLLIKR